MSEEAINRLLRRKIGCTIHEINAMIGYWLEKYDKERMRNKELQKENAELKEKLMIATKMEIKEIEKNTFVGIDYYVQQNKQLKERIEKINHILNNQMDYREFVDIVNAIEEILKGDKDERI